MSFLRAPDQDVRQHGRLQLRDNHRASLHLLPSQTPHIPTEAQVRWTSETRRGESIGSRIRGSVPNWRFPKHEPLLRDRSVAGHLRQRRGKIPPRSTSQTHEGHPGAASKAVTFHKKGRPEPAEEYPIRCERPSGQPSQLDQSTNCYQPSVPFAQFVLPGSPANASTGPRHSKGRPSRRPYRTIAAREIS